MPKFVLTYHGGSGEMPDDPKAVEAVMAEWGAWFGSMGEDLVDGGNPFSAHGAIGADGKTADLPAGTMSGFSVLNAADLAAATKIAQSCPVLKMGASVQISEAMDM